MEQIRDRITGMSRGQIKKLALVCMFIDHMGVVVLNPCLDAGVFGVYSQMVFKWYWLCRMIGRIAFPIFVFFLTEGFFCTKNRALYQKRLLIFACLSEIPFNLAISGNWLCPKSQNTMMTLALGFGMMQMMEKKRSRPMECFGWMFAAMAAAYIFRVDYSVYGIALTAVFYWSYTDKKSGLITGAILSFFDSISYLGAAALAYLPLSFYRREEKRNRGRSWGFYLFYPLHLLVLYGIQKILI